MNTLEQRVAALEAAMVKNELMQPSWAKTQPKEWPQVGDVCWAVDWEGEILEVLWGYSPSDMKVKQVGGMYHTLAEAKAEVARRKTMTKLREIAARENGGWVPDWKDGGETKYTIGLDVNSVFFVSLTWLAKWMNQPYFKTKEGARRAIDELGDELKGMFV